MSFLHSVLSTNNCSGWNNGTHQIWQIPVKLFNSLPIKRWKYNRPPDIDRVAEIHAYMAQSKRMDGMIYVAEIGSDLVCYESNHRREALKGLDDMAEIIVDIMFNTTHDAIKEEFLRLNKAVSVPELYLSEKPVPNAHELVTALETARNEFCAKYAAHKSTSGRPQKPNFNSDSLLTDFNKIMEEKKMTIAALMARLEVLNAEMSTRDRKGLSDRVIEKCTKSGLWLFAWNNCLDVKDF
jgi:hypothetical protein